MNRRYPRLSGASLIGAIAFFLQTSAVFAQNSAGAVGSGGEGWAAELKRMEEEIRTVRAEYGNQYRRKLAELRAGFQKAADLENALVVRELETRLETDAVPLDRAALVAAPRLVRDAQTELLSKQGEVLSAVVQKGLPKLVEMKRSLTIAGRLDEASDVLTAILGLYEGVFGPAEKISNASTVSAEELYLTYQAARKRADQMYKGRQFVLRGRALGIRPDPREPSAMVLVVFAEVEGGYIDCAFGGNLRLREERQGQSTFFVLSRGPADPAPFRFQKGTNLEVLGKCEGGDDGVRMHECSGCNLSKR